MSDREDDPALDFLSMSFDPVKALQCSPTKLHLPHSNVQPCDNLDAYTSGMGAPLSCNVEAQDITGPGMGGLSW